MSQPYHFLGKKSITIILVIILLLPSFVFARVPNDDLYPKQKEFWDVIGLEKAWDFATGSPQVVVAVIDTGADIWHKDLENNIWINPYEIADNGIDDDNNGYVDDINGWNFIENNNNVRPSVFENTDDPEAVRHGTVIAGLIGEQGNNNKDGTGVNWQVKVMPLRAIDSNGSGLWEDVAKAIDYAVKNGAMVISLSMVSTDGGDLLRASLRAAFERGVVIVAAAGNEGSNINQNDPVYPICIDQGDKENWIVGVGSVHPSGKLSWFSNYGDCVDLYAPGDEIYSIERYAPQFGYGEEFGGPWKGTSFAAPIVAGAAALIKSLHPDWKADKIIETILSTATNFYLDKNQKLSAKILNVGVAAELAAQTSKLAELDFTYYYYFSKNEIRRRDRILRDQGVVARLSDIKIIDLATKSTSFGKTDLAVLIQRGSHFYVRLYKENGVWWQEFAVSTEKLGKEIKIPKKITWNNDEVNLLFAFKKKTRLVSYSRLGKRLQFNDKIGPTLAKK